MPSGLRLLAMSLLAASLAVPSSAAESPALHARTPYRFLLHQEGAEDAPILVTLLDKLPLAEVRSRFPMLLVVKWSYVGNSNGLPTDDEAPLLYHLDEAVDDMLGTSGRWAMTRTGGGVRRSYFYAAGDRTELLNAANRALQSAASNMPIRFGITVDVREQPAWDVLREGLAALPPSRHKLAP